MSAEANAMEQIDLPLTDSYLVGCRVNNVIQHYRVDAVDQQDARKIVKDGVAGARPILTVVQGGCGV